MKNKLILIFLLLFTTGHIKAHVALLSPAGGEIFSQGQTITISWQELIAHNTLNWDLYFSSDGGLTWDILQLDISVTTLSYQWILPDILTSQARIRVVQDNVDSDYTDESDNFTISAITGIDVEYKQLEFNVFPNPFNEYTTLKYDNPENENHTLLLYNISGSIVKTIKFFNKSNLMIERGNLPNGVYLFQLSSDTEIRASGRVIIN